MPNDHAAADFDLPEPSPDAPLGVLFVCMGNICRSPLAEGVFIHLAKQRGLIERFNIDSAGTGGWHVGATPDPRSLAVAQAHGIDLPGRARQIDPPHDWNRFHLVVVMDHQNLDHVLAEGAPPSRTTLLRAFDPDLAEPRESPHESPRESPRQTHDRLARHQLGEVPDPYYGGDDGFNTVYTMVHRSCERMLEQLANRTRAYE